jgi:hypothetical protein
VGTGSWGHGRRKCFSLALPLRGISTLSTEAITELSSRTLLVWRKFEAPLVSTSSKSTQLQIRAQLPQSNFGSDQKSVYRSNIQCSQCKEGGRHHQTCRKEGTRTACWDQHSSPTRHYGICMTTASWKHIWNVLAYKKKNQTRERRSEHPPLQFWGYREACL